MQPHVIFTPQGPISLTAEEMSWIGGKDNITKLKGLVVCPRNYRLPRMPVFDDDTLEKVIDRWAKMYPSEASGMIAEAKTKASECDHSEKFSVLKLTMKLASVPDMVYFAMKHLDSDFWDKNNFKNWNEFFRLMPIMSTGSQVGYKIGNVGIIKSKGELDDKSRKEKTISGVVNDCEERNSNPGKGPEKRKGDSGRNSGELERGATESRNRRNLKEIRREDCKQALE